ncbi:MAG TPA: hypothetical protein EYN00_05570, partial [Planctomycetes bacterium]|nr:hypothetical protein [Planctomycetota bacterium]
MSRWKLRTAIRVLLALALLPSGCGSEGSGGDAGNPVIELPAAGGNGTRADPPPPRAGSGDDGTPPLFEGGSSLVAFDGGVLLRWQPASDGRSPTAALRYRVYTSPEDGEQDFSRPSFETEPGEASIIIPGQEGERLFVVVRAVDEAGNEDSNETQWQGTPFPVLLVDPSAEEGGDGLSVETALRSLDDAIGIALGFEGVNIFMVAGEYQESVLLFEGMMVYGGFAPGFQIEARDPEKHRTILFAGPEEDIIVLPPGETPCGLDGITLDGRGQARRGVVADDCSIHIAHCTVQAFQEKGIELRSEYDSGSD